MSATDSVLICGNVVLATLLIRASAGKLVTPGLTASALSELFPGLMRSGSGIVRATALAEGLAALSTVIATLRLPGQILVALLGAGFVLLGVAGLLKGSQQPCGCFGASSTRPLGTVNIAAGLLLLLVAAVNFWAPPPAEPANVAAYTSMCTAIASIGWLFWSNRDRIRVMVSALRARTE
ncbi:MauE/DoxX family redox-associated membrane protein [Micromonospora sp. NPDC049559]|uniref:MauE/DoxX family redox-associated membrane protein n=1 Tax=Micromonospora sp. NPDC049559 TaxID=3155923 RepID=UPI003431B3CC